VRTEHGVPEVSVEAAGAFIPPGQLFLECAADGRVLWMNEKCRQRLGEVSDLAGSFGAERSAELLRFLAACAGRDTFTGVFDRADGRRIPVKLYCFTRLAHGVILSAEVRGRVADRLGVVADELCWLQGIVLENFFRLLRVQQELDSRSRRSRRNSGLVLIEQLERERARLGRELHSGPGQWLSAITVHVELIEKKAPELPPEIREYLTRIAKAAAEAGAEIRAVAHRLHPLDWQTRSLPEALRNLWDNSGIPEKFQGSLTLKLLAAEPSPAARAAIYRAAQEALTNASRHSGATAVSLTLEEGAGSLYLKIEDNGRGFDPAVRPASGGIGLATIREQVEALGGNVGISSGPEGTKLEVSVPLESTDA
jgi:signal transduction histidine kinase